MKLHDWQTVATRLTFTLTYTYRIHTYINKYYRILFGNVRSRLHIFLKENCKIERTERTSERQARAVKVRCKYEISQFLATPFIDLHCMTLLILTQQCNDSLLIFYFQFVLSIHIFSSFFIKKGAKKAYGAKHEKFTKMLNCALKPNNNNKYQEMNQQIRILFQLNIHFHLAFQKEANERERE